MITFLQNDYDIRRVYIGPFDGRPLELRNEVIGNNIGSTGNFYRNS